MKKVIASVMFVFIATLAFSQEVIPGPSQIKPKKGAFQIDISTPLIYDENNPDLIRITSFLNTHLQNYYGFQLHEQKKAKVGIQLIINDTISLGNEGYILDIDKKGILIAASKPAGIFYGIQTVKQLLPIPYPENKSLTIPYVEIRDQPRFVWRGLHLDVSRHFFPVSFIKKYLDYMAMYKLNTFHWHLTDDQGWRLEINKHPELTEISSWRDETIVGSAKTSTTYDGIGYGGFYTQKQIREIVQYATDRYITIVPEIEMPGHTSAVLVAFPDLGCTGGPYNVLTTWEFPKMCFAPVKKVLSNFLRMSWMRSVNYFRQNISTLGATNVPKTDGGNVRPVKSGSGKKD
jgi:hexosaminidase